MPEEKNTIEENKVDLNKDKSEDNKAKEEKKISPEEKIVELEDKLTRSFAELENQRRRFEKEIKEAFTFGGFNFAKEILSLLDNLSRAQISIKNDQELKENKDLDKFLKNIDIIEKDIVKIFEKNNIKKIDCLDLSRLSKRFNASLAKTIPP